MEAPSTYAYERAIPVISWPKLLAALVAKLLKPLIVKPAPTTSTIAPAPNPKVKPKIESFSLAFTVKYDPSVRGTFIEISFRGVFALFILFCSIFSTTFCSKVNYWFYSCLTHDYFPYIYINETNVNNDNIINLEKIINKFLNGSLNSIDNLTINI